MVIRAKNKNETGKWDGAAEHGVAVCYFIQGGLGSPLLHSDNVKNVRVWVMWLRGEGESIPEQKLWNRRVHNVLQEKQGPMLLGGKGGVGSPIKHGLRGHSECWISTPLWEAVRGFSARVKGDQLWDYCNNPGETQWCVDQAGIRGGGRKHLASDAVFRSQKDVNYMRWQK